MKLKKLIYFNLFLKRLGYSSYMSQIITFVIFKFSEIFDKDPDEITFIDIENYKKNYYLSDLEIESLKLFLNRYLGKDIRIK
ncbi:MAG: hypothetical protein GYA61_08035 [Spirochaetales bacterium]|jgi:hypothetical protein|nr:hypothetical protein [Exilispira sp.]NMC68158.1 hypothetical protein [Spirochaetales bacterium]